jgi:hypothetical protein
MSAFHGDPPGPRLGSRDAKISSLNWPWYASFAAKRWRSDIFVN